MIKDMTVSSTVEFADLLDYRFDAECYQSDFLAAEHRIGTLRTRPMSDVANVSDGNHVSIAGHYAASGVRYLKGGELSDPFIDDTEPTLIPENIYASIPRAHVQLGDVLLSVIGTVGPVALVTDKYHRLSCSCKLAILRPHGINGSVLAAYLLSSTGQTLLRRRNRGSVQQGVVLPDIRKFPVPFFSDGLATKVARLIREAASQKALADQFYPEAEDELLERIGWGTLGRRPEALSYVRHFSEIAWEGRADAEFYRPFYAKLRKRLVTHGEVMANLVSRFDKGTQPVSYGAGGVVVVVKSKQVTGRGLNLRSCLRTTSEAWDDKPARLSEGDLVINSTGRGTLGRAAVVPPNRDKVVAAVDLIIPRLNRSMLLPEYAALFFNSPLGLAQSDQFQTGSSGQLHLYPEHLAQFVIFVPRTSNGEVDIAWQKRLAGKVEASFTAKVSAQANVAKAVALIDGAMSAG